MSADTKQGLTAYNDLINGQMKESSDKKLAEGAKMYNLAKVAVSQGVRAKELDKQEQQLAFQGMILQQKAQAAQQLLAEIQMEQEKLKTMATALPMPMGGLQDQGMGAPQGMPPDQLPQMAAPGEGPMPMEQGMPPMEQGMPPMEQGMPLEQGAIPPMA